MKIHYKKYLLRFIIASLDDCCSIADLTKYIIISDAIKWIAQSWSEMLLVVLGKSDL